MVLCHYCSREIEETALVCPYCSALQKVRAAANNNHNVHDTKTNPPFIQLWALFAIIYLVLLFLAGLAETLFSLKCPSFLILIFTIFIISYLLAKKVRRQITKKEIVVFSIGACAVDVVINLGVGFFTARSLILNTSWMLLLLVLLGDFIVIFFQFGYFTNQFVKYIEVKKTYNKNTIKRKRIVTAVLSVILALDVYGMFFSTFLPNPDYRKVIFYIILIASVASTACLEWYLSLQLEDEGWNSSTNQIFKKRWVRIPVTFVGLIMLIFLLFGQSLPWIYTYITGSEGELFVKVTGWNNGGRNGYKCEGPYVNNEIFYSPPRGLCAKYADRYKYSDGTTLRLKGNVSAFGINVNQMEVYGFSEPAPLPAPYAVEELVNKAAALCPDGRCTDYQKAMEYLNKAILLKSDCALGYSRRAKVYYYLGNYNQAIADYDKAIELYPNNAAIYHNRGNAYSRLGNYNQAITDFDKSIKLYPKDAFPYIQRGSAYNMLSNYNQAIVNFNKAIELNPQDANTCAYAYHGRAIAYHGLNNYNQAITDYDKAIELNSQDAVAYKLRAIAYQKIGNNNQALADIKIAARLGDKNAQDVLKKKRIAW